MPRPPPNENAVFDANGDGTIENWGFLHGGDSYTTFTPPPTGADPTRGRKVETRAGSRAHRHARGETASAHGVPA